MHATREHSGVLIFVSLLEREVRIIADKGICQKVPQEKWNAIASDLAKGFSPSSELSESSALLATVKKCGDLLKEHFPPLAENPNELKDTVTILEDGE